MCYQIGVFPQFSCNNWVMGCCKLGWNFRRIQKSNLLTVQWNTPDMCLYMEILMNTNHQFPDSILRIFEIQVDARKALDILSQLMLRNIWFRASLLRTNSQFSCIWKFLWRYTKMVPFLERLYPREFLADRADTRWEPSFGHLLEAHGKGSARKPPTWPELGRYICVTNFV